MVNKLIKALLLAFFLSVSMGQAALANPGEGPQGFGGQPLETNLKETIDLKQMEVYLTRIDEELAPYVPEFSISGLIESIKAGEIDFSPTQIFQGLLKYLFKEIVVNTKLLGQLIILAVLAAVLRNLQSSFDGGNVGKIAYTVIYFAVFTLAIGSFAIAINIGKEAVDEMVGFMQVLLPILLTLLAAVGGLASAALFHPVIVMALGLLSTVVKNVVFPLIFFSAILGVVNNLSEKFKVDQLAALFRQASLMLILFMSTIFMGVFAVQGVGGAVADGVALRTAKFATDNFIPVVGKMFSDAIDATVGGSLIIKNTLGIAGVIIVFILCALPALKILALIFIYKLAAAIMQPVGTGQIIDCLSHFEKSLTILFGAVAMVGLIFFFVITIVVGSGNFTTMLR